MRADARASVLECARCCAALDLRQRTHSRSPVQFRSPCDDFQTVAVRALCCISIRNATLKSPARIRSSIHRCIL